MTQRYPSMLYIASFSELWERFSFYIVEALLVIYLVEMKHLQQSYSYQLLGTYIANSFILTVVGAYFGQNIIGYRQSVNLGACLMSIGYALLLHQDLFFLKHGLSLIVVGSAFFKPNMACFIGTMYKNKKDSNYYAAYNVYYMCIMFGVILSTSISGYIVKYLGWDVNFSLAAFCMLLAFLIFFMGNQLLHQKTTPLKLVNLNPYLRWLITLLFCIFLWVCMHIVLRYNNIAHAEIGFCVIALCCYFISIFNRLPNIKRRSFVLCIVLLCFASLYWAILFQQFFSFNLMIKFIVNRHFLNFNIPSPVFMGVESLFVIIFSPILATLWIKLSQKKYNFGLFTKFGAAFFACALGLGILVFAITMSSTPHFLWIILSYLFIGLGEAILAPTALAMIGHLNEPKNIGVMMGALYMFWGFGTKFADVLATWSVYPATLKKPDLIAPYFLNATIAYFVIAVFAVIALVICKKYYDKSIYELAS